MMLGSRGASRKRTHKGETTNRRLDWREVTATCLVLVTLILGSAHAESDQRESGASTKCCFKNSRYAGVCVVQPAEGETCASILDYLNNPSSSGKSYCGFTEIRGGWEETTCSDEKVGRRSSVSDQIPDRVGAGPDQDKPSDPINEEAYRECWN